MANPNGKPASRARTSTCLRVVTWSVLGIDNLESLLYLVTIQGLENPGNNLPSSRAFLGLVDFIDAVLYNF